MLNYSHNVDSDQDICIKLKMGSLLFTILLDQNFFQPNDSYYVENHNHFAYEVHFIMRGSTSVEIMGQLKTVYPHDYYIIGPGIFHENYVDNSNKAEKYTFRMEFQNAHETEETVPSLETEKIREALSGIHFFAARDTYDNYQIIQSIQQELRDRHIGFYMKVQSLFTQLVINIVRDTSSTLNSDYPALDRCCYERRTVIIEDFFEYNYQYKIEAVDLAKLLHISVRQLNRILKNHYNMSFKQKLLHKRIEIAKNLLKNTPILVKDIAQRVGYETESNFFALFKQKTGYTPKEYRAKNKVTGISSNK